MNSDVARRVREFIVTNFAVPGEEASLLTDDLSLLDQRIVDSTGVLEIIGFIEREFAVQVAATEMLRDNLDSIDKITAFVARKKGGA